MIKLKGKHNTCKVFTDNIDNATIGQLITLMNQSSVAGSQIRIMPDTHAGKGCVIGTTMTISDKVIPNLVGVDIGCFTGDTEVWCSAGYYKPIKDLVDVGRFMTDSFDLEIKGFVITGAVARKTRENAPLVRVNYDKYSVRCTPDHKFLVSTNSSVYYDSDETELKWVEAKDLKPGMQLVAEDAHVFVKSVEELTETEDVYCLTVENTHNFAIKGGVIVHNCGMAVAELKETRIDLPKLDSVINKKVPSGFSIRDKAHKFLRNVDLEELYCYKNINVDRAEKSLGTLGGGNHFIEVDTNENGQLYLVVHTGSRNLGKQVAEYYQDLAWKSLKNGNKGELIKAKIDELKAAGRQSEIEAEITKIHSTIESVPKELAYCEGELFDKYIHDMKITQEYAYWNREAILDTIVDEMHLHVVEQWQTIHNYIDTENMILRKGAVSAQAGEKLLIPINMRDGSLICLGKGNPDWNYSVSHGAGRLMSRSEAKQNITLAEFKKTMKEAGIYSTSVNKSTIDESPMAYKPMQEIIDNIGDTVEIVNIIKPVYNFKAGEEG